MASEVTESRNRPKACVVHIILDFPGCLEIISTRVTLKRIVHDLANVCLQKLFYVKFHLCLIESRIILTNRFEKAVTEN